MIEAGVITKDVEQFICINLKVDAEEAMNIEESILKLIDTDVLNMLPDDGQIALIKLQQVLEASLLSYQNDFDDNEQYIGSNDES